MKYSNLDILSINQILFSSTENRGSLGKQLSIFFGQLFFYTFLHRFKYKAMPENYKGILFVGFSKNNQRSLTPIIQNMQSGDYISLEHHKDDVNKRKAWWISLPYIFTLIKTYRKSDAQTRKRIKRFFTDFWTTYGLYHIAEEYLIHYKVNTLVLSNDHNTLHRCLILRAKEMGIKTVYVQHASVTAKFPKLLFDYSFLDGEETFEKYLCAGQPEGNVFLSGGVRFDNYHRKPLTEPIPSIHTIGVAINMVDDFERVKELCLFLIRNDFKIVLRPHPRYGAINRNWLTENGIMFSDPTTESSSDFISHIDCMISNQSAIHLDAAIMNCPSVLFNFSTKGIDDYYSFVKNGLTKEARNYDELKSLLAKPNQLMPANGILRYYNANCNTPLYGRLGEIIASYIKIISSNKSLEPKSCKDFREDGNRPRVYLIRI